jgi:hypothetical protein
VNAQQRSLEDVENQNDETIEGLSAKVKMLKDVCFHFFKAYLHFVE